MENIKKTDLDETLTPLRRLQLCELEMLNRFVAICEKHKFRYFLVGGTLLGAVRHQGFIPWDDDIDVAMLREDYDKFAQVAQEELGDSYFYQDTHTDPYYFLSYAKIRKNGTKVHEERFKDSKFHQGVFIDIFPLDYCFKGSVATKCVAKICGLLNRCGEIDSGERVVPYDTWGERVAFSCVHILPPRWTVKVRTMIVTLSSRMCSKSDVMAYSGAYGYAREVAETRRYYYPEQVEFEEKYYTAIGNVTRHLCQLYGEQFMQLPPEEQRVQHLLVENDSFYDITTEDY